MAAVFQDEDGCYAKDRMALRKLMVFAIETNSVRMIPKRKQCLDFSAWFSPIFIPFKIWCKLYV